MMMRVAVDGPSGAGKSTIAKKIAGALDIEYIDTGAMYRAVALKAIREDVDVLDIIDDIRIELENGKIILDGEDVSGLIRTPEVTMMASSVSAVPEVRTKLVELQRDMGRTQSVIMDGRDIGTNVFTDAEYKFFMTASPEERARRRVLEQQEKGMTQRYEEVLEDIQTRDYNDSHRALNPLRQADDAILIDTDGLTIDGVVRLILSYIK
ncbi:MAG: (d)CMP kinase [Clostridiales Family XIII bacterium]|nr:(d)CMP kinase [Clostridiales Family XIII bacterium]